jgi:hypothetical protein
MRKMMRVTTALCLTASVLLASRPYIVGEPPYYDTWPEERVGQAREDFKDAAKLKEHIERQTSTLGYSLWKREKAEFRKKFDVSEETLQAALMAIIRESSEKVGWEETEWGEPPDVSVTKVRLYTAVGWLGFCADAEAKKFLMGIAMDETKREGHRMNAVLAYLRCADAQETKDAFARFLANEEMIPYFPLRSVLKMYDETEENPLKREVIFASIPVALAREKSKSTFADTDNWLAQRSKEYAESAQRLAMLERISKLPPLVSFPQLEAGMSAALESLRSSKSLTSVSTNLTELMARDFRKKD